MYGKYLNENLLFMFFKFLKALTTLPYSILAYFIIDESPRFLLLEKKYDLAIDTLDKIISSCNGNIENIINENEKLYLIEWAKREKLKNFKGGNYSSLISSNFRKISIFLWINIILISITYFGIIYLFPIIFQELYNQINKKKGYFIFVIISILVGIFVEVFFMLLNPLIIEIKFIGRRRTIIFGNIISVIMILLSIFTNNNYAFLISISITRGIISINQDTLIVFSSELYTTEIRNMGVSVLLFFSKIAGIFSTFFFPASNSMLGVKGPSVISLIFINLSIILMYFFKYETRGLALDKNDYRIKLN